MEKLRQFVESGKSSAAELARMLGVKEPSVAQWCSGKRPVPLARCAAVERVTHGFVTRRDLRPDDWWDIWPELAYFQENHAAAPVQKAQAAIKPVAQGVAHG